MTYETFANIWKNNWWNTRYQVQSTGTYDGRGRSSRKSVGVNNPVRRFHGKEWSADWRYSEQNPRNNKTKEEGSGKGAVRKRGKKIRKKIAWGGYNWDEIRSEEIKSLIEETEQ